jgi:hypothetical protein
LVPPALETDTGPQEETVGVRDTGPPVEKCTSLTDCEKATDPCLTTTCVEHACVYQARTDVCAIGGTCYYDGQGAPDNPCKLCDLAAAPTAWTNRSCDDQNACTQDTCGGTVVGCANPPKADGTACTPDGGCTLGACQAGACQASCGCLEDQDCKGLLDDLGECERTACNQATYVCQAVPDAGRDGQACGELGACTACTEGATCAEGSCQGGKPKDCTAAGEPPCWVGVCDEGNGSCTKAPVSLGTPCDDADPCTVEDLCDAGTCHGKPKDCSELEGICRVGLCKDGACYGDPLPKLGKSCATGAVCMTGGICLASGFCADPWDVENPGCDCAKEGNEGLCDDGLPCTGDSCNETTGICAHTAQSDNCAIQGVCMSAQTVNPLNPCQFCDPNKPTVWSPKPCDDQNGCTVDTCTVGVGCEHQTLSDTGAGTCDDTDPCSTDDHCEDGVCVGSCQCTTDEDCAEQGLPAALPACHERRCIDYACTTLWDPAVAGKACEDGDACTTGEVCEGGSCGGGQAKVCDEAPGDCLAGYCDPTSGNCGTAPIAAGTGCSDSNPCTLDDNCDGSGSCQGEAVDCGPFAGACHASSCVGGACVVTVLSGNPCDDLIAGTLADACDAAGVCAGLWDVVGHPCANDLDCDDGLSCTLESCTGEAECIYTVKEGACAIGGACYETGELNPSNACQACQPPKEKRAWSLVGCPGSDQCIDGTCLPEVGCVGILDDTNPCSDGDPCTSGDHCEEGSCVFSKPCPCKVDSDCTGAPTCTALKCEDYDCVPYPDPAQEGAPCDDGSYCTVNDSCQAGGACGGTPRDCSAAGQGDCMAGVCDDPAAACLQKPVADSLGCSDGDPCTEEDLCAAGVCIGTPVDCSELDADCTEGVCTGGSCVPEPVSGPCDDGNPCTANDLCVISVCGGTWDEALCACMTDTDCDELDGPCAEGVCKDGACFVDGAPFVGEICDDGNLCTSTDVCTGDGTCAGILSSCSDNLECTLDLCLGEGACEHPLKEGRCLIDVEGEAPVCFAAGQPSPSNPCERCGGGTTWSPSPPETLCDDGAVCTHSDHCQDGACNGTSYACDDGLACTQDGCTGLPDGCTFTVQSSSCLVGGVCYGSNELEASNPCHACRPNQSQSTWTPIDNPCADGNPCTHSDQCLEGTCQGTLYSCDDSKACTTDLCHEVDPAGDPVGSGCSHLQLASWCLIGGTCYASGQAKPGNKCLYCFPYEDQFGSKSSWTSYGSDIDCEDGLPCTASSHCDGYGSCKGDTAGCQFDAQCETATCQADNSCLVSMKAGWCKIPGQGCVPDGTPNPANPCQECASEASTSNWTNDDALACVGPDPCQTDWICQAGACLGQPVNCDDGLACTTEACVGGICNHELASDFCLIGQVCLGRNAPNPENACQWCEPSLSAGEWVNIPQSSAVSCTAPAPLPCAQYTCGNGTCQPSDQPQDLMCYLGGACYAEGALNPANPCQSCQSASNTWGSLPAGSACPFDQDPCTTDQCDSGGTCTALAKPDFAGCQTPGQLKNTLRWCIAKVCENLEARLDYTAAAPSQAYFAGGRTPHHLGTYGLYEKDLTNTGRVDTHFLDGMTLDDLELLAAKFPVGSTVPWDIPGISANEDVAMGNHLFLYISGDWRVAIGFPAGYGTAEGLVLQDWTELNVAYPDFVAHAVGRAPGTQTPHFIVAGMNSAKTKGLVRSCVDVAGTYAYSCTQRNAISSSELFFPVGVGGDLGLPLVVGNYQSPDAPKYVDFLNDGGAQPWKVKYQLTVDYRAARFARHLGSLDVGGGDAGLLFVRGASLQPQLITKESSFADWGKVSFYSAALFQGNLIVLGRYDTTDERVFVAAYTPQENALTAGAWTIVELVRVSAADCGGCVPSQTYRLNFVTADDLDFDLWGSWYDVVDKRQEKAHFRWVP